MVRKEKPKEEVFEYKKRLTLDHEKSKQSLTEIYEQEYLKQTQVWLFSASDFCANMRVNLLDLISRGFFSAKDRRGGDPSTRRNSEAHGHTLPKVGCSLQLPLHTQTSKFCLTVMDKSHIDKTQVDMIK